MNSLIGKSTGIALLMAAALLAALFAMGVFSPSGAGADVVVDDTTTEKNEGPTVTFSSDAPGAKNVDMTVKFQIAVPTGQEAGDVTGDITITLPGVFGEFGNGTGTNNPSGIVKSMQQGDADVGTIPSPATSGRAIVISPDAVNANPNATPPVAARKAIQEGSLVTVVVGGITNPLNATTGNVSIAHGANSASVNVNIPFAPTLTSYKTRTDSTMTLEFRANTGADATSITVTLPSGFSGVATGTGGTDGGDDDSPNIGTATACPVANPHPNCGTKVETKGTGETSFTSRTGFTLAAASGNNGGVLTITDADVDTDDLIKVTIAGLTNPEDTGVKTVIVEQGTNYKVTGDVMISSRGFAWIYPDPYDLAAAAGAQTDLRITVSPNTSEGVTITFVKGVSFADTTTVSVDDGAATPTRSSKPTGEEVITLAGVNQAGGNIHVRISDVTLPAMSGDQDIATVVQGDSSRTVSLNLTGVNLTSTEPSAAVRVEITTDAGTSVPAGEDIVVTLGGFGIPSTIDANSVLITSDWFNGYSGPPADIVVGEKGKVTLSLASRYANGDAASPIYSGRNYSVVFKQSAGITNPASAGEKTITVSDRDTEDAKYKVTIERVVKLSVAAGKRGTATTATLLGFADGTATVNLNDSKLAEVTIAANVGTLEIDTTSADFKAQEAGNKITATDADGNPQDKSATFRISPMVTLDPAKTQVSKDVTIKLSDWVANDTISKVEIGGTSVDTTPATVITGAAGSATEGTATFTVNVPKEANRGTQTVKVTGTNLAYGALPPPAAQNPVSAKASLMIDVITLSVEPKSAVPGQQVTVTGSGFKGGATAEMRATEIKVGDIVVPAKDISGSSNTTSTGAITVTFEVPTIDANKKALATGDLTIEITETESKRVGEATLTVPKAAITLSPTESSYGSTVTVSGTGFVANESVDIIYAVEGGTDEQTDEVSLARVDGSGQFEATFEVPSFAKSGKAHKVTAKDRDSYRSANAEHTLPAAAITMSPMEVAIGQTITITGANFPLYQNLNELKIGTTDKTPSPKPLVGADGTFTVTTVVPQLALGPQPVSVRIGEGASAVPVTDNIRIVEVAAPSAPAEVFASLGARLVRVWQFDNATQTWSYYDPRPEFAEHNTLATVASGQIVTVIVSEGDSIPFNSTPGMLYAGTNQVVLD